MFFIHLSNRMCALKQMIITQDNIRSIRMSGSSQHTSILQRSSRWDNDVFCLQNRHLEMLLLHFVAGLFCRCTCWSAPSMCCYLHSLADFCWSTSSSKLNYLTFLLKEHRKCVTTCTVHASKSDEKYVLHRLIRMRVFVLAHICTCRKWWAIQFWSGFTLMQGSFKNIK